MKRFAAALLAGVMVLGSTAFGDEIVLDDGFAAENEAIGIPADALLDEADFADYEDEYFVEEEFEEGPIEEISELGFSEDEENLDDASLIEDVNESADEDALTLADEEEIPKAGNYGTQIETGPCGAYGNSIQWTVYDSDGDSVADTLVFDGSGIMADFSLLWERNEQGEYVVAEDDPETTLPWVHYSKYITRIICNGTISHIGNAAFAYTAIKNIDLASFCDSNLTIGAFSFYNCIRLVLTEINMSPSAQSMLSKMRSRFPKNFWKV